MKEIQLTRGLVATVDDEDFDRLAHFNWQAVPGPQTWYAQRAAGRVNGKKPCGKQLHLGSFHTELEAALAYNEAAKEHFGEFSRLNEVPA